MSSRYEREVFGPRLDIAAVDRIVAAVPAPAGIDRRALLADLEGAHAIYRTGVVLRKRRRPREQVVAEIVKALECGRSLLGDYIKKYGMIHLRRHRAALDGVLKDIHKENSPALNRIVGLKRQTARSSVEQLVIGLCEIFERHYGIKVGYTDNKYTEETTGLCVDFIDAVLRELGIHYDRGSIARTMRKRP
jgi:hypothetical protein